MNMKEAEKAKEVAQAEKMAQMEAQEPWMWDMPPGMPTVQKEPITVKAEVPKETEAVV